MASDNSRYVTVNLTPEQYAKLMVHTKHRARCNRNQFVRELIDALPNEIDGRSIEELAGRPLDEIRPGDGFC